MFNWLRGIKTASSAQGAQNEDSPLPQIRKPQHAYRDARMSIPVAEREFYETMHARRKRSSGASSVLNGKGKGRSPLAYDSGEKLSSLFAQNAMRKADGSILVGFPSYRSTPGSSQSASHNSSCASTADLTGAWAAFVVAECCEREDGGELGSLAESSKDARAREGRGGR